MAPYLLFIYNVLQVFLSLIVSIDTYRWKQHHLLVLDAGGVKTKITKNETKDARGHSPHSGSIKPLPGVDKNLIKNERR